MQLNREELLKAYKVMNTIRNFEEKAIKEAEKGNIAGSVHLYAGEEASATAVMMQLSDKDYIASTHSGHGHCIAKGVDVIGMMKELFGRKDGICGGKGITEQNCDCDGTIPLKNYNCDGDCIAEIDCMGICGGDAIENNNFSLLT